MSTNIDSEIAMWEYWRDKCGFISALENYYPGRLAADPVLTFAVAQAKAASLAANARMKQLQCGTDNGLEDDV